MPPSLKSQAAAVEKMVKSLQQRLKEAGDDQTYENMIILTNLDQYECPEDSGIFYRRKMLKPAAVVKLGKLQNMIIEVDDDPQKRMDNIKDQAMLCLSKVVKKGDEEKLVDITKEDWEETDGVLMEQIVAACFLMTKSFRKISKPKPPQEGPAGQTPTVV